MSARSKTPDREVRDYFVHLASMKPARRAFLEASLAGVLIGAEQ